MAIPLYFQTLEATVDGYAEPNLSIVKPSSTKRNAFGGVVFEHTIAPNNAGGSVSSSSHVSGENSRSYQTYSAIIPNMALVYSYHGGVVTPNYGDAVDSINRQFNFVGLSNSSTSATIDNWVQQTNLSLIPSPRMFSGLVYIPSSKTHFLFGGLNTNLIYGDTWQWSINDGWVIPGFSGTPPTGRYNHMTVCDTAHHSNSTSQNLIVLFGGQNLSSGPGTFFNDAHYFDGSGWDNLSFTTKPSARHSAGMVFETARSLTVLFGGIDSYGPNDETWELDLTDLTAPIWTQNTDSIAPQARYAHGMVYDSTRLVSIVFGGTDGYSDFTDTWEYDGFNWHQLITTHSPPPRLYGTLTYHMVKKKVVLFGGFNPITATALNDVWLYDGVDWAQDTIFGPSVRAGTAIDYDVLGNFMLMFGGANGITSSSPAYGDMWQLTTPTTTVNVQTTGDGYVYYDATGVFPIPAGRLNRTSNITTVTTTVAHNFIVGSKFIVVFPGDPIFNFGVKTVTAVFSNFSFTYSDVGVNGTSSIPVLIFTENSSGTSVTAKNVPAVGNFLGASNVSGTVTPTTDGFSPIFGYAVEDPVIDPQTLTTLITTIGNPPINVGLIKMRIESFYGFRSGSGPSVTNFIPGFGTVGTQIRVDGTGFITTTQVTFSSNDGGSVSAVYQIMSANALLVNIPAGAQTSNFRVVNSITAVNSNAAFTVVPGILNVSVTSHSIGSAVTITGNTFTYATGDRIATFPAAGTTPSTLTFNGIDQPTFTVHSDTNITTTIPAGASTGAIVLTTPDGIATFDNFLVVAPPVITNIAPLFGAPGSLVSIVGTGFLSSGSQLDGYGTVDFVKVGGGQTLAATRTIFNNTQMSIVIPSMPSNQSSTAYHIVITNDGGVVTSTQIFSILPIPTFLASPGPTFSPSSGASGTVIDILGKYGLLNTTAVSFGTYLSNSITQLTAQASIGQVSRTSSTVTVHVVGTHGFSTNDVIFVQPSADNNFPSAYVSITSLSSSSFSYTQSGSAIASTVVLNFGNDSHIKAVVPVTPGVVNPSVAITITGIGGTRSTTDSNAAGTGITSPQRFTILLQPTLDSFTPNNGATGTTVQILGNNLLTVDRVFFTSFSAAANSGQVSRTSSTVSVTTSASHGFTTGDVVLVDSTDGYFATGFFSVTVSGSTAFTYTQSGAAVSSTVAISFFDTKANAAFTILNNGQINAIVPAAITGLINGPITIAAGSLFAVSLDSFTYLASPTISGLNKTSGGYGTPPTQVVITGTHLINSNNTAPTVTFGGVVASVPVFTANSVTAIVPNGAGNGIVLTTDGGSTPIQSFTVIRPPVIYNSTPTFNCYGNFDPIYINGNNFIQADTTYQIYFYHQTFNSVTQQSINNTQIIVNSNSLSSYYFAYANSGNNFNVVFTIYFTLYYDSGNGSYSVSSPQTFTDGFCIT